MTPKTFSAVAIGESFTHRGKQAIKISGNRYRFATDAPDSRGQDHESKKNHQHHSNLRVRRMQ